MKTTPQPQDTPRATIQAKDPAFKPSRTKLGTTLREIRRRYLLSGGRLLTAEEIDRVLTETLIA